MGRSGTPEEVTSLGWQSCLPGQEQVRRKRPRPPLSFTREQQHALQVRPALRAPPLPARAQAARNREAILRVRRSPRAALGSADAAPAKFKSEVVRPHRAPEADGLCRLAEAEPGGRERPLPGCSLRTRLLLRGRPIPGSARSPRREAEPQSRVPRGRGFTRGCMIISSLSSSSLLASVPAPFPLPPRSCPCSLQSGFWWMVGS